MATKKKAQTQAESSDKTKARLYNLAQRTLRERHVEEFTDIISGLYAQEGLTYRRRLTAEERAEQAERERNERAEAQLAKLVERYPHLGERVSMTRLPAGE